MNIGMKTVFVGRDNHCVKADYSLENIGSIDNVLM